MEVGGIMTKKIFFVALIFISVTISGSSNWRLVTESSYSSLNGVFLLNENLGWIAGSSGTILKTTDGGKTWERPTNLPELTNTMYSVFFINENLGFAGGSHDLLLKSTDGGDSWSEITFSSVDGDLRGIYFANENEGWILSGTSSGGQISYTSDGGANWTPQATETSLNLKAMAFYSSGHGVCVGGKSGNFAIYYTTDGQTWSKAPTPTNIPPVYSRTDLYAVAMASETVACVTGWGSSAAGLQPSFTIRTSDGGANWKYETQTEENRLYNNMYGMTFLDEQTGIAVGGSTYKGSVAYKTVDGGISWEEITFPFGFSGKAISAVNNKIVVVGSGGGIAVSDDAGSSWKLATEIPSSTLYVIDMIGDKTIIATGFYGAFLRSDDLGLTWKSSFISDKNACPTVKDLYFLDENIGYSAQNNRVVAKTTDGGKTWTQIMKDTLDSKVINYGVQFIDENIGFVVGKFGSNVSAFYKTTDGGTTWSSLVADPNLPDELNALYFFDESNGVVVGDETTLSITEDGGDTWSKITPHNLPSGSFDYGRIEFLDNNFGLVAGDNLIKTTDGGKTWEYVEVSLLTKEIKGIAIVDEMNWYLTGSKFLLKTVDGGATWSDILDLEVVTATTNYDVLVDNSDYPWLACGSSEIYTAAPVTSVNKKDDNLVNSFSLEANYPNPFNPSTKIVYSVPNNSGNVTLTVHNLLGQKVATLVNEVQKAGTYEAEFNASELTSGIYIYTLQNAGLSQSRKMLLIK